MAVVRIYPLGKSGLYYIAPANPAQPDQGLPGQGGRPDQGLPGYGHPDQGLPGYGHPDQGLPGMGGRPDNALPAIPGVPDNSLPGTAPPTVASGKVLVMIRSADGKWKWAALDEGAVPTPLPEVPAPTPV